MSPNPRWELPRRAGWGALGAAGAILIAKDLRLYEIASYGKSRVGLVLIAVALGALLGLARLRVLAWGACGLLALVWLVVAFTPLTAALADGVPRRDPLAPADAVYVLASDVRTDGTLTEEALYRLSHGLELVKGGLAPRLILGELRPPHAHYATGARSLMDHLGITAEILTVGPVDNTHDEAVRVAELCRERGWRRIIVVTSPMHSRRAAATFERQGLEVASDPAAEGRFAPALDSPDERIRGFPIVLHERIGLWLYARRGWL